MKATLYAFLTRNLINTYFPKKTVVSILVKETISMGTSSSHADTETGRGHPVQRVMGPLFVVLPHPLRTDLTHLIQRLEHVGVDHLMAERSIE